MTDTKALPSNLKQIEKLPRFVRVYKDNTVEGLKDKLDELEVDYLSADDKGDLTWRYMDHLGMDFNDPKKDRDNTPVQTINKGDDDEKAPNALEDNDSKPITSDGDEDGGAGDQDADEQADADKPVAEDSDEDNRDHLSSSVDAPSSASNSDDDSANQAQLTPALADQTAATAAPADSKADAKQAVEAEHISIKNNADFDVFEPATRTLMTAGKTTKIYITARISRDRILQNINQYNKSRGEKLIITN